jgi:O-antigen ligase
MRSSRVRPVLVVASALTLFVFAFPVLLADLGPAPFFYLRLLLFPADVTLAVTLAAAIALAVTERRRPPLGTALLAALTVSLAVAWVFHPSPQGVLTVARFAGASALAYALGVARPHERVLAVGVLAAVALAQTGLAAAQLAAGGPLGLPSFGEVADPLIDYNGDLAPRGTMHTQYVIAGLALLASVLLVREGLERARPLPWLALVVLTVAPVGTTFSRAIAVAVGLVCGALAFGVRRRPRATMAAIAALALGAGLTAFAFRAGWELKGEATAAIPLNGRDILFEQSVGLIADSPIVGIGPGRSVEAKRIKYPSPPPVVGYQPAHELPLLAAVEGGLPAGALALALLVVLGWRARRDPRALALYLAFLPVVLTEHYPYTYLQGLVLLGTWVGMLDGLSAPAAANEPPRPAAR